MTNLNEAQKAYKAACEAAGLDPVKALTETGDADILAVREITASMYPPNSTSYQDIMLGKNDLRPIFSKSLNAYRKHKNAAVAAALAEVPARMIPWQGGDKAPCEGPVLVKFSDDNCEISLAHFFRWKHLQGASDIVAYLPLEDAQ